MLLNKKKISLKSPNLLLWGEVWSQIPIQIGEVRHANVSWMTHILGSGFDEYIEPSMWLLGTMMQLSEALHHLSNTHCVSLCARAHYASFLFLRSCVPLVRNTLKWHNFKIKSTNQIRKGLRWRPRHPDTKKGVVSNEMLQGIKNKCRFRDFRIGEPFKLLLNLWTSKRQLSKLKHLSN